jgi:hypothetical protein
MTQANTNVVAADDLLVGLDFIWSDGRGVGVKGWILSTRGALEEVRLRIGEVELSVTDWHPRPDVSALYPHCPAVERCGFQIHLPQLAQHELNFIVQRRGETLRKPLTVSPPPPPIPCPYTDGTNLLNEFTTKVNERGWRVLEIGSRIVSPGSASKRTLFPGARSYTGFDYYPDANTDVVGDAHKLSQYFNGQRFDAIFSIAVLEHLAMPWVVAREINKVLEVGALTYHLTVFAWPLHEIPWDFWRFSDEGLKVLFSPALGFEIINAGMFGPMRTHLDQVVAPQEMLPYYPTFGGSAILARKVADVDEDRFRWEIDVQEAARGSSYPQPQTAPQ